MVKELIKLIEKQQLQKNIFCLEFKSVNIANTAKPGQFINILVENFTLRRPFTIFEITNNKIKIGIKIKGCGTKKIATWNKGRLVNALGPLGNGFLAPKLTDRILIIGGGVGCFALLELAKHCNFCYSVLGFKTIDQIIATTEFEKYGPVQLCIENDKNYTYNLVTEPLENLIKTHKINRIACCGPTAMMKAVFKIAKKFEIFCEVCLEERMACGIGSCLGCQCLTKQNGKLCSKHVCCDGPVFNAKEVFFN